MAEIKIYLTKDLRTDFLHEASRDLISHNLKVTHKCAENLSLLSPKLSSEIVHDRVKQLMAPHYVSKSIVSKWNEKEAWVSRMLVQAKAMAYPEHTDNKLGEHLYPINQFTTVEAALGFLSTTEFRLNNLLSMKVPLQLSFLGYGAFAYAENRVLRKAIFSGSFLTNPKVASPPIKPSVN